MLQVQHEWLQHLDKESKRHSLTSFSRLCIQMKESIPFILLQPRLSDTIKRRLNRLLCVNVTLRLTLSPLTFHQLSPNLVPTAPSRSLSSSSIGRPTSVVFPPLAAIQPSSKTVVSSLISPLASGPPESSSLASHATKRSFATALLTAQ